MGRRVNKTKTSSRASNSARFTLVMITPPPSASSSSRSAVEEEDVAEDAEEIEEDRIRRRTSNKRSKLLLRTNLKVLLSLAPLPLLNNSTNRPPNRVSGYKLLSNTLATPI